MNYIKAIQEAEENIERLNAALEREYHLHVGTEDEGLKRRYRITMLEEMRMEQELNLKLFRRRMEEP